MLLRVMLSSSGLLLEFLFLMLVFSVGSLSLPWFLGRRGCRLRCCLRRSWRQRLGRHWRLGGVGRRGWFAGRSSHFSFLEFAGLYFSLTKNCLSNQHDLFHSPAQNGMTHFFTSMDLRPTLRWTRAVLTGTGADPRWTVAFSRLIPFSLRFNYSKPSIHKRPSISVIFHTQFILSSSHHRGSGYLFTSMYDPVTVWVKPRREHTSQCIHSVIIITLRGVFTCGIWTALGRHDVRTTRKLLVPRRPRPNLKGLTCL